MSVSQPYIPQLGDRSTGPKQFRSSRRAELKIWWREIDRGLLFLILILMAIGTAAVAAGSDDIEELHPGYVPLHARVRKENVRIRE